MAGTSLPSDPGLVTKFQCPLADYDVRKCKIASPVPYCSLSRCICFYYHKPLDCFFFAAAFFPCIVEHRWVCYAWSTADNTIAIYDAGPESKRGSGWSNIHLDVVSMLKNAMHSVVATSFVGWNLDCHGACPMFLDPAELMDTYVFSTRPRYSAASCFLTTSVNIIC